MTQRELLAWIAYYEVEPWGESRADLRTAIVAATVHNMLRGRGTPARQVADFLAHRPSRKDATPAHIAGLRAALAGLAKPKGA